MTTLREDWLRIVRNGKTVKVNGFTGVGGLFDNDGEHIFLIAADEIALRAMAAEFLPAADLSNFTFQNVTVIKAQS